MKQIIILGHKGMLGQMAFKYYSSKGYNVITLPIRYEPQTRVEYLNRIKQHPDAILINCIGRIKQKTDDTHDLLWANAILPLDLAKGLLPTQTLIHPSTDCVFAGTKGKPYQVDDAQDATDDYGWSKQLGEQAVSNRKNTHIIRVSIIGTDHSPKAHGLLGWFLSQPTNVPLNGYTNHLWNGITTLEWCKYAEQCFSTTQDNDAQVHQPGTHEHYSKYDMLCMFNDVFTTNHTIQAFEPNLAIDRRLAPLSFSKNLKHQLEELKQFDSLPTKN